LPDDIALYKAIGEALAIGLLVGIERYKSRDEGERNPAGVRTFAVISLMGAIVAILGSPPIAWLTFGALFGLLALGYWRDSERSLGITTEMAAMLTFWLGYLVGEYETLAVGTAIVLVVLLAHKKALHGFVNWSISEVEFYDTLKFLLVVFVVYPLLPDTYLTPYEYIRPTQLWMLVILVSTISFSGYILIRLLGGTRGLQLNALVGGLVSTTAVTVSLADRASKTPELTRLFGVTAVMANAVQGPRLLLLIWVVDPVLGRLMLMPLLGFCASGLLGAFLLSRFTSREEPAADLLLTNPYSFLPAMKFALLFAAVLVSSKWARHFFGEEAIYAVSGMAGLVDASAISISVADMFHSGSISVAVAGVSVLIAVAVNAAVKLVLAGIGGNGGLVFWLGGGLVTMVGTAAGLLILELS